MNQNLRIFPLVLVLGISLLLSSCQFSGQNPAAAESDTPSGVLPTDPGLPLPDQEAVTLMTRLSQGTDSESSQAVEMILANQDTRFVSVFLELLRANQIGLSVSTNYQVTIETLESLSGKSFGSDWPTWVEWYGKTDLQPPPGFTGWKGQLLGQIDPGFAEFLQDDLPSTIRTEEIMWGGVQVDGIPALDNAVMIAAEEGDYLDPAEPVFGISINGDHRAYPLRILDWHEMANDVVGDVPVSLAYCTLCGAGIAYDGRASDGKTYTFGSSGFLFRSNKLMYDRQTRTLWNQLTGEPVIGPLVGTGVKLDLLPVVLTTWQSWLEQHPDTIVLDSNTGFNRPYAPGAAYGDYFAFEDTMFPVWQRSDLLETKDRIYALQIDGIPKAYPVDLLVEEGVVNDQLGDTSLVLIAARGEVIVEGENQRVGAVTYNAGGEVRAYNRGKETFFTGPEQDTVLDAQGQIWQVTEEALVGPEGESAPRVNGHLAYWFGWFSFFPKTLIYEKGDLQSSQGSDPLQTELPPVNLIDYGPAPELQNKVWLNTPGPLRLEELQGKVVLLEMWTFT
jgi:hypothetical protein